MRKIIGSIFLLTALNVCATHNRAGEILYKRIAPFSVGGVAVYTYSFSVIKYTDNGQNIADRCEDTLYFGDGQKAVLPRTNTGVVGCGCLGACGEIIISQLGYVIKKNIYSGTHTYAAAGSYLAYTKDPNRNNGVINIPNSVNIPFYIESLVIANNSFTNNSSPVFANPPVDRGLLNDCYFHNPCAYDEDGDSLSYEITNSRGGDGNPAPGFTYPTAGGGSFSINPGTGLLTWCTPQLVGEYNFAIIVKEWRRIPCNGGYNLMGYVLRDMQAEINSSNPVIFSSSGFQDTCIVAGTNFAKNFSVNTSSNVSIAVYGSSNNSLTLPNSNITVQSGGGIFNSAYNWNTNCDGARKLSYQINLVFTSNVPYPLERFYKSFNLKIVPPAPVVYSVQVGISNVQLIWNKPVCTTNLTGYKIYRKTGINNWAHSACETGVPAYSGFYLQDFKLPNDTTFTDTDFWNPIPNGTPGHYIVTSVLSDCSESFANINNVVLVVGIKENALLQNSISVFPNPFLNKIEIDLKGQTFNKVETNLFSADGKLLLKQIDSDCSGSLSLITLELDPGLYFLKIKTEKGTITKKLVKE